jgi:hypothetical protein
VARKKKFGKIPGHTAEPDMAKQRGVKVCTLQKERSQGRGPPYIVVNKQVHYVDADYPVWLQSLKVDPPRSKRVTAAPTASRKLTLRRHNEETAAP